MKHLGCGRDHLVEKTADEICPSICDFCEHIAIVAVFDRSGDEKLLCKSHMSLYKDWRFEQL